MLNFEMTATESIIMIFIIWNFVGLFILGMSSRIGYILETDRLNPLFIYKDRRVNWFGAICLAIAFNLLCPVVSIGYWFYKLCTVGRRY